MNNKGTSLKEVLFIFVMFAFLVLPFLVFKLWWWLVFLSIVVAIFGAFEIACKIKTGRTLSQRFWYWSIKEVNGKQPNRIKAWVVLASLGFGWAMLLLHLAWKMIK